MKNKYRMFLMIVFILFILAIAIPYIIIKSNNTDNKKSEIVNNINEEKVEEPAVIVNEYNLISTDSEMANNLLAFVPKHFQGPNIKIDNEYIIYTAISSLQSKNIETVEFTVDDSLMQGYKYTDVEQEAKTIFGNDIKITMQNKYKLPIVSNNNMFSLLAFGFAGNDYLQYIKEVKESKTKFILTIYAINIEYDLEDENYIKIATKDTFKLYSQNTSDINAIENSMIKYKLNGIVANAANIVADHKDKLPSIEYEIEKLDDRGTKYYLRDMKVIY